MAKRVLITTDVLGRSNEDLGRVLMRSFLVSLSQSDQPPAAVMLVNEGVRLACEGSEALTELQTLVASGVPVTACGTCLKFLGLSERLVAGSASDMPSLVAAVCGPDDVVTIG
jgi:selenium metabolism protein YedF